MSLAIVCICVVALQRESESIESSESLLTVEMCAEKQERRYSRHYGHIRRLGLCVVVERALFFVSVLGAECAASGWSSRHWLNHLAFDSPLAP